MMSAHPLNRRSFLQSSAVAGSLEILPRGLRGADGKTPGRRINIALVGVGGRNPAPFVSITNIFG